MLCSHNPSPSQYVSYAYDDSFCSRCSPLPFVCEVSNLSPYRAHTLFTISQQLHASKTARADKGWAALVRLFFTSLVDYDDPVQYVLMFLVLYVISNCYEPSPSMPTPSVSPQNRAKMMNIGHFRKNRFSYFVPQFPQIRRGSE